MNFNCECIDENPSLTLAEYRTRMMRRLGFSAIAANPPPGMADLLTTFLQDAQDFLYLKYPALRTRRFFRWTTVYGERYYGLRDNDENWTDEVVTSISIATPGVVTFVGDAPANGRQIYFTVEEGGHLPTGLTPYERYYVVESSGSTCEMSLTEGGPSINTSGTTEGEITAHHSPGTDCTFNFDPYKNIEGAWLELANRQWIPMTFGIPPVFYTTVTQPSMPLYLEIRQCIEIFPAPNQSGLSVWIKGHFGKRPFVADSDKPTIDGELVYLWALSNAMDYYQKPSRAMWEQAREHLGSLVAGTHTGKRYVPGVPPVAPAVMPVFLPYPGEYV